MIRTSLLLAVLALAPACRPTNTAADSAGGKKSARGMRAGVFVSDTLPPLRLRPDSALSYLGAHPFTIGDIAAGERHVFVEAGEGGVVRRMLVLQFEGMLPTTSRTYRYPMTNPVVLGGRTFASNAIMYRVADALRQRPDGELAATVAFLEARGLALPDTQTMARYATVLDRERRHELLIFYHESGAPVDSIGSRALRSFTVQDPTPPGDRVGLSAPGRRPLYTS